MDLELIGGFVAILAAVFSAVRFYFVRKTVSPESPFRIVLVSSLAGLLFFGPVSLILNYQDFSGLSWIGFFIFFGAGLFLTLWLNLTYESVRRVGASRTSPIICGEMIIASLIAILFLGETVETLHLVGIFILFSGVALVSYETGETRLNSESIISLDLTIPLTAMIIGGIISIFVRIGYSNGVPVTVALAIQMLTIFIVMILIFSYKDWHPLKPFQAKERGLYIWAAIAFVAIVTFWNIGLSIAPVVIVVPLRGTAPLFVLLISYFYLKQLEKITKILVIGAILTVLGGTLIGIFM